LKQTVLAILLVTASCSTVWADGGAVIASERAGDWQISVLVSPALLTVGPADVSVLVQDANRQAVDGLQVTLDLVAEGSPPTDAIHLEATRAAATNKLFYAAQCELPSAGRWQITATVADSEAEQNVAGIIEVAAPPSKWVQLWKWIAWPAIVVALFILRERLVLGQRERKTRRPAATTQA
jgi:hypothetical protein